MLSGISSRPQKADSYLNSVPLAAQPTWGEIIGLGEGLQAWFGSDPDDINELLWEVAPDRPVTDAQARAFAQVLGLIIAERRPTFYLRSPEGRARLAQSTVVRSEARTYLSRFDRQYRPSDTDDVLNILVENRLTRPWPEPV